MCGIGVILNTSAGSIKNALTVFNTTLAHRGPDDEGTYFVETAAGLTLGLAQRRLAILDLSPAGHQPMVDKVTRNAIVFNGEIYNYQALAAELKIKGEHFVGTSDTEVLLKAYKYFDASELLRRLRGMFAFAIWDAAKQKLLIARDPCGIKPLYYTVKNGGFACASEAKALARVGLVDGSINPLALDSFLSFGSVQAPLSIYQGAHALLPGHMMWVSGDGSVEEPVPYWSWVLDGSKGGPSAIARWLAESMRRHLVADVPVAIFLSGGFDSTALTTLAMQTAAVPVKTFTMGFPEVPQMSEANAASAIAARLGTEHHRIEVREADLQNSLPTFFTAMDQPSDDGLNVFLISQGVAQAGIKACMHGVGGDELFGGYPSFRQVPKAQLLSVVPPLIRRILAQLTQGENVIRSKLTNLLRSDLSLLDTFLVRRSVFSYEQRHSLLGYKPPLGRKGVPLQWYTYAANRIKETLDSFGAISTLELAQYAGNKLLADGDVMSMAHGLELRFPLLDVDLICSVLATSESQKLKRNGSVGKPALTQSVRGFPIDLMSNRKQGFTLPLERWIRREMRNECRSVMTEIVKNIGLECTAVDATWRRLDKSNGGQQWLRVWQLYTLGCWFRHGTDRLAVAV